jgi:meiotic recombination protein SPO11
LSSLYPTVPILALVDFDPDGFGIISTYKHGSINLAHEPNLAVSSMQWLGVRNTDFLRPREVNDIQGLLKLSARDRRIARKMLEKEDVFGEEGIELEWRKEMQVMLMLNVKAEIQVLGNGENLRRWLDGKLLDATSQR